MIKTFFKLAYRNLIRNKSFSALNISGLAVGMASAMLILLWVQNELSFDRFYKNTDRLYQVWSRFSSNSTPGAGNVTPKAIGPALKKDYPEVEKACRVNWDEGNLFTVGDKRLNSIGVMADPDFLYMFGFPLINGNIQTALHAPGDIVITEKLAKKLFGTQDALGKAVLLDNQYGFKVCAVMKDLPNNTQFDFEFVLPWTHMHTTHQDDSSWDSNSTHSYVLLKPNADVASFNNKIKNLIIQHCEPGTTAKPFLYPLSRLHLYSNFVNGQPSGGGINTVRVFIMIACFILLIACINFMNMSTASSEKRAREVGIRKVAGASKRGLIGQFLSESILIAFLAGVLGLLLAQVFLPAFNRLIEKNLIIDFKNVFFILSFLVFILVTGLVAGSYPAFFLSSFKPVSVLKGTVGNINTLVTARKLLVILQFTFAVIMIVCTMVITKQLKYGLERETGYTKNNLVYIFLAGDMLKNYTLIKNEMIENGLALGVSKTSAPLTEGWSSEGVDWVGKSPNDPTEFNTFNTDGSLVKAAGMQLTEGRDIDLINYPTDSSAAILNETAARIMGFTNPVGQTFNHGQWHIIGVVKDFIIQSPYEPVKPMILRGPAAQWFNVVHVKLNPAHTSAANLAGMEKVFKKYNPEYPLEYHFIDEQYEKKFNSERTMGTMTTYLAGLTIFISCLGLFGLTIYMASSRTKEIGVRKVLGASVLDLVTLLSKDFVKLVIISILIASTIAWWAMQKWLSDYSFYRINLGVSVFLEAGLLSILIAICTICFQAVKAATSNPVKSLRSE